MYLSTEQTALNRHLDGVKDKYRKEIIMKKTMIKTFFIDEARKAEGKPFKTIGETYILNGFWKKKSVEGFLDRIKNTGNFVRVTHHERWDEDKEYFEIKR